VNKKIEIRFEVNRRKMKSKTFMFSNQSMDVRRKGGG
jgi:hypothetical protein